MPPGLLTAMKATPGVAQVAPPETNPADDTAVITVMPTTAPDAQATSDLVSTLRERRHPTGARRAQNATRTSAASPRRYIDVGHRIADRLPYFIGAVVLLSFLLLMLVFHSIVIPATAAAMNLLSVGAAYGVTVAVFQWGWAKGLLRARRARSRSSRSSR